MKKIKFQNGITLIALVITVVVLLILASIAIADIASENGIIKLAETTKNNVENNAIKKNELLNALLNEALPQPGTDPEPEPPISDGDGNGDTTHTCSFTNYTSNNDATCTSDGTKTAVCDISGCDLKDEKADEGSKLDHSFTKYVSNNDATCAKNKTETAPCDNKCGATFTRDIPNSKLNTHTGPIDTKGYGEWNNYQHALIGTCSECKETGISKGTDDHDYSNNNGRCKICNWYCTHKANDTDDYYNLNYYGYCNICGVYVEYSSSGDGGTTLPDGGNDENTKCKHEFNVGTCIKCGLVCDHIGYQWTESIIRTSDLLCHHAQITCTRCEDIWTECRHGRY